MAPVSGKRRRAVLSSGSYFLPRPSDSRISTDEYALYLQSDHWAQVKKDYATSGLPQECWVCHAPKFELHHLNYHCLGAETWDDLVPLCPKHHRQAHKQVKMGVPLAEAHKYLAVTVYYIDAG